MAASGAAVQQTKPVDFAGAGATLQLQDALSPYHSPDGAQSKDSRWYILNVGNSSPRPVTRILRAGEPADAALHFFPRATRARLRQVASSDGSVTIERQSAFGRYAFRVTIPPATTAALALRVVNADSPPAVLAWNESALVAHNRQLAIFVAAVAGLIAAAALVTAGLAAMTSHVAPRWAALTLGGVFAVWLARAGLLDQGWNSSIGGPYGFSAMVGGFAFAAGIAFVEAVAPVSDLWPWAEKYRRWTLIGIVALSLLAFIGVPGATPFLDALVVFGVAGLAAYLVRRGVAGSRVARALAPSAAVFALVTLATALAGLGAFHGNLIASEIAGGFAAAGAVLMALAVAAGEGLSMVDPRPATLAHRPVASRSQRAPAHDEGFEAALGAIGASHQGVYDLNFRTDTLNLSKEAASLIGFPDRPRAIDHSSWIGRVHADDRAIYKDAIQNYRSNPGLAFRIEFRVRNENGRYPWFELRGTMIGGGEAADGCLGLMADITGRKEAEAAALDRTRHDSLTGLGNRVALLEELERLGRRPRTAVLALLDIDRFKAIHASLGDSGADAVLQHVAERLTKRFGETAAIFRTGGDAFALMVEANEGIDTIGPELVELCGAPLVENGRKIFAPISVGIASGGDVDDPLDLLRNAELALHQAKRQGGGRACLYSHDLERSSPGDTVTLETELRRALEENQIDIFYQPIVRLSDRTVAGFEALLRWHHPQRGLVWPADFVGHSEESGLIVALGKFALTRAAEDLARWQQFFPVEPALFISVNVSRRQLQDDSFEASVADVLKKIALADGSLRLEVTESAIAADEEAAGKLAKIRALGAGLAIDDFGTGLSSLSQLQSIPFDIVKVDRSFLSHNSEGDGEVVLNSIVNLARELKRGIVVEGVESEEDAQRLAAMGCELAQGYHFSVPLPAREALNFIALHYDTSAKTPPQADEAQDGGSGASGVRG